MNGDFLKEARRMIRRPEGLTGVWPRAAALLARQALESAMDRLCMTLKPGLEQATRATQLSCLGFLISDQTLVADVRSAWSSLSRACHHHHYELGPTAAELEHWISQTERLVAALGASNSPTRT